MFEKGWEKKYVNESFTIGVSVRRNTNIEQMKFQVQIWPSFENVMNGYLN